MSRYDGVAWRSVPRTGLPGDELIRGVDAVSATDVWVVGDHRAGIGGYGTMAAHWDGTTWTREPTPNGDAWTPGDVWAVGSSSNADGTQPYVARFDGTSWRRVATPTMAGGGELTDVVALSPSAVVAVGRSNGAPLVLRWNGASWTRETTPGSSNPFVTGAAAGGPNTVWAVGYRFELSAYSNRMLAMLGT